MRVHLRIFEAGGGCCGGNVGLIGGEGVAVSGESVDGGSFVVLLCTWSWIDRINTFTHSREQIGSGSFIIHGLQREREDGDRWSVERMIEYA